MESEKNHRITVRIKRKWRVAYELIDRGTTQTVDNTEVERGGKITRTESKRKVLHKPVSLSKIPQAYDDWYWRECLIRANFCFQTLENFFVTKTHMVQRSTCLGAIESLRNQIYQGCAHDAKAAIDITGQISVNFRATNGLSFLIYVEVRLTELRKPHEWLVTIYCLVY